jgi:erythronate-4-phosphate dehydrogenase
MIYIAACEHFNLPTHWQAGDALPAGPLVVVSDPDRTNSEIIRKAVFHCYDVRADDRRLRELLSLGLAEQPAYFDRLRKEYPVRREFQATRLVPGKQDVRLEEMLRGLGFDVRERA